MSFMVIFESDSDPLSVPMGWDRDCEGALCCFGKDNPPVIFPDRQAAQRAVRISERFALLLREQGKPHEDDFLPANRKFIKIVPCVEAPVEVRVAK